MNSMDRTPIVPISQIHRHLEKDLEADFAHQYMQNIGKQI